MSWKTPIEKNAFEVPLKRKDRTCCWPSTRPRIKNGANFVNSNLFQVNEQKYFASTDGSYIDQDVHRIWPVFGVTAIDSEDGQVPDAPARSARPCGRGYEYLDAKRRGQAARASPRATRRATT